MTTQSIRNSFGMVLAATLVSDIQYSRANYYYYLGKISPWREGSNEGIPPDLSSEISQEDDNTIRANMMFVKKISPSEVSLVINRYEWTAGTIYDRWDDTINMIDKKFYVVTSSIPHKVYKCIDNANGARSMNEPSTTSYDIIKTADGYLWKYMYSIPAFKMSKFGSPTHMPVQRAISDSFYNNGFISDVIVNNGGINYSSTYNMNNATTITVTDTGHTAGSGAAAKVSSVSSTTGAITGVTITAVGSGYSATYGARATITNDGIRGGAVLTPVISVNGTISSVTITSGGLGYSVDDVITISVGGASFLPAIDANGSITSVKILDPGIGYVTPPVLSVAGTNSAAGAYGSPTAQLTAILSNTIPSSPLYLPRGSVVDVIIPDPGVGYVKGETTAKIVGDGTGATCSTLVSRDGIITDIILNNRGSGYTYANVVATDSKTTTPLGSGATFTVNISQQDYSSDQANVEQTTTAGAIFATEVIAGGSGYTQEHSIVTITGDGTGARAKAIINNGSVSRIEMIEYGMGYSMAKITVTDSTTSAGTTGQAGAAVIRAIYTPPNGHGFDAPNELFARTVGVSTILLASEELDIIDQEYRQYGILRNPNNHDSSIFSSVDNDLLCYQMFLDSSITFIKDEIITYGEHKEYQYIVAHSKPSTINGVSGTTVWLVPQFSKFVIPIGQINRGNTQLTTRHTIKVPIVNKYSGQLLLTSNENKFTFDYQQSFAFKSYIKL